MKKLKKIIACLFIFILCISLASCELETEQGNEIKAMCQTFLDAVIAQDEQSAKSVIAHETDPDEFSEIFGLICEYTYGIETYTLRQTGFNSGIDNGYSYYEAIFDMESNVGNFQVSGTTVEGYDNLYNFNIISEEDLNPSYTGTITSLKGSNPFQILLLLVSAACLAFSVVMLIDCFKHKMKYKPLWIILILAGIFAFTLTYIDGEINFNWRVAVLFFSYTHLAIYETGAFTLNISIPLGALLYLALRKKLHSSVQAKEESVIAEDNTPANEPENEAEEPKNENPYEE